MKPFSTAKSLLISISLLAILFYYFCFYPGYMSFDSSSQYSQVLSGEWNTISPIIMVILWTFTDKVIAGPGGLFLFFLVTYWLGIVLFSSNLNAKYWLKITIIAVVLLWPFNLMIIPHLWKDVGLVSFLSLAIGLIQLYKNTEKLFSLYLSLCALIIASLFRFESIAYIVIIEIYVIFLLLRHFKCNRIQLKLAMFSFIVFLFGLFISNGLVLFSHSKKVTLWQTVALWDLASVSIKVNSILMPSFTKGQNMTVNDLSNAVVPWSNTLLFWKTKVGVNSGLEIPYSDVQYRQLFSAWLAMLENHPIEYFSHRFNVANDLLRYNESINKPLSLLYSREMNTYADSFPINNSSFNKEFTLWISLNKDNIIFKGWFYLSLEIILLLLVLFKKEPKEYELLVVLSASGIMSVLTLYFVSPSAEQRYLIWLINSTLLSIALFLQNNNNATEVDGYNA